VNVATTGLPRHYSSQPANTDEITTVASAGSSIA